MLFIKILSKLPFPILYLISDFLYLMTYHIFKYRMKVVRGNLKAAFPEKSEKEINAITRKFYRNLCDLVVEILKTLSLSEKELTKRVLINNIEIPLKYLSAGQSIIVLTGHLYNWEWLLSACMVKGKFPIDAIYKPLSSKFSDKLMLKIRSKFGATPVAMNDTLREQVKKKNIPHTLAMVADQTPLKNEIQHWVKFFNQDTPYYVGADKIGKMLGMPVFFAGMKKIKRGHYEIYFKKIAEAPYQGEGFPVTDQFNKMLEEEIRKEPAGWLWSHRRWKHKKVQGAE
ncbi:MAG: lysophospholipid acyltransferase family protein [Cytophagaceae bacterium]|nr:lysophospholipid acyltransferase family protein [Cytophagaceae bacterium]